MTTLFDTHEEESVQVHEAQRNRLQKLLEQKAQIEEEMRERVVRLQAVYRNHEIDLRNVVEDRARRLG